MRDLLGVSVPDDAHGCLQDIHWAFGELGYFPTYALGNVVAAQLWAAARAALAGPRRRARARATAQAAARLAARARAQPRPRVRPAGAAAPGDRPAARSRAAAGVPASQVRRAVRPQLSAARSRGRSGRTRRPARRVKKRSRSMSSWTSSTRLARVVGVDLVDPLARLEDLAGVDLDVRRLALEAGRRLVDQDPAVGQRHALALARRPPAAASPSTSRSRSRSSRRRGLMNCIVS